MFVCLRFTFLQCQPQTKMKKNENKICEKWRKNEKKENQKTQLESDHKK